MVADLQDVGVDRGFVVFREYRALDGFFGVARKEQSAIAEFQVKNQRVVVFRARGDFSGGDFGLEELLFDAIPRE